MELSELRILYEVFNENRENVRNAINSINKEYVSLDDLDNGDYFSSRDYYYSDELYTFTNRGDVQLKEDCQWCPGLNEYVDEDEDFVTVYEGSYERRYSRIYADNNSELFYYNGEYYDSCAMDRYDLVWLQDTDEIQHIDNAYYHDGDGWYSYPDDREEYVRGYHNGSYKSLNFDGKSKYKIGYEIEKEDEDVRNSIDIDNFEEQTDNVWRKEKDGSLDDCCGYELISPTFELNIDKIFEHIEGNPILVSHIDAGISSSCGGHIHLSQEGLNGNELFNKLKGYTPLFYALYYGRVSKTFSKGKSNRDLENENEKYQAIKIHHDRVEFRIISAVPSVKTLKWRTKLLMMILQHPTHDIMKAYYNVDTKFTKLLKQTYSDNKLVELKERFIKFTKQFEDLDIKDNN
jgi:hypothetical protein